MPVIALHQFTDPIQYVSSINIYCGIAHHCQICNQLKFAMLNSHFHINFMV